MLQKTSDLSKHAVKLKYGLVSDNELYILQNEIGAIHAKFLPLIHRKQEELRRRGKAEI
jgi:hypothetical protein